MTEAAVTDRASDLTSSRRLEGSREHTLQISVVGNVAVTFGNRNVKIKSRKSLAVLAYIALNESQQETRERLVGLFWSETEEEKARASLRQTLRELRRCFAEVGYSGLQAEKLAVELEPQSFQVDLWDVIREAEARRVHPMLLETPRLADRLLASLDDIDPSFRAWILAKRQTFHDRLLRTLEDSLRRQDVDARTRRLTAEALVSLDPTHEEACRSLMRSRAEEGDIAGALRVYKTLWDLLDDEYGMEPSAKTQQLVAEIKQGDVAPTPPQPSSRDPVSPQLFSEASIARLRVEPWSETFRLAQNKIALLVSPFQMNGVDADKAHLVHGFRHHLIASLVRFREWSVVDGMMPFPRSSRDLSMAAHYGIDATAYQAGQTANVVLTLRHNETNTFIWSESFELKLENWFEAQQRIIRRTTSSLNVQLSTERLMRLAREPDVSLEVYDRWLRGQELIFSFSTENWQRAAQIFTDVIRDAPHFSSSYNSLVQLNNTIHFTHPGFFRDLAKARETIALARTAVQLDPVDFRAQLHLGWSLTLARQYAEAEVHVELASELNENDPWTLMSSALYYAFCGKFERAARLAAESFALSPSPTPLQWGYQTIIHFLCGELRRAVESADHAGETFQTHPSWKIAALHHLGRRDESVAEARRFLNNIRSAWFGSTPPTDEAIARWLMHTHPIRYREDWERLRDGVAGAGIPTSQLEHESW